MRIEVRPVVSDDDVRNSISECQFSDEADGSTGFKILDRLGFNPFGKLVDCYKHMSEAAPTSLQGPNHIQPPNGKGPDEWNSLQG